MTGVVKQVARRLTVNGQTYLHIRGRPDVGPVPADSNGILTRLKMRSNGVLINPPPPGRDNTSYGTYIPDSSQVGLTTPLSSLSDYNSPATVDFVVNSNLGTVTNKIIYGRLKFTTGGRIDAVNCWFAGPAGAPPLQGETAILDFDNPDKVNARSTFLDCMVAPRNPHPRLNGFKGSRFKAERCHVFWVTDGFGPYTKAVSSGGGTWPTEVEIVACRVERLVYWPGAWYSAKGPTYWNGTAYQSGTSGATPRTSADGAGTDYIDSGHNDGNHTDCIEIHSAYGSHTFSSVTGKWTGNGVHIWGNALINSDGYGLGDPSGLGVPVPGQSGSYPGSRLGWGDNYLRGLNTGTGNGQRPGMTRPPTSWAWPLGDGTFPGIGTSLYIGQVTGYQFGSSSSVVCHQNYLDGGSMAMQEQKKSLAYIEFHFYDNIFGPHYFMWNWALHRDMYPVRINDLSSAPANFDSGAVIIHRHPVTNSEPFGPAGNNKWLDPTNDLNQNLNGTPLLLNGSGSIAGVRFG